jgi:hypothetical protein
MIRKLHLIAVLLALPLLTITVIVSPINTVFAEEKIPRCPEGEVAVKRTTNPNPICVNKNTADRWVKLGFGEILEKPKTPVTKETPKKEEVKTEKKMTEQEKAAMVPPKDVKSQTMEEAKMLAQALARKSMTGTITSVQDPGKGHESHQLAIILPPSDKIYRGHLTYSATEPTQLVALHGPLKEGQAKGQPTWTPDGKTKFALTFVNPETSMGMWTFSGNALAVHTMNPEPFTVTYAVSYTERILDDELVFSNTMTSAQDPGLGHESHQLAIILPPREKAYNGYMTYSASENVQLVTLVGPLEKGQVKGQATWTPDGETYFGLMLVDPKKASGSWQFSGNAVALHTMNPEPFTVSYSAVLRN